MSNENEADDTATTDQTDLNNEQVKTQLTANNEGQHEDGNDENLTEEQQAEKTAQAEKDTKKASDRTLRRRQQRNAARAKRDTEALTKSQVEAAYWRGKAEAGGAGQQAETVDDGKPKRDDFEDYDDFVDARIDWKNEQKQAGAEKPAAADNQGTQQQPVISEEAQKSAKAFNDTGFEKFGEDFSDMMEAATNGEFQTTQVMYEAMLDGESAPDIAMFLYDNPDEAARIASLTPVRQMKAIQGIEASIKDGSTPVVGASSKPAEPRQKTISGAPEPVTPVKGGEARVVDMSKLSTADYIAKRQKQLAKK